MRGVVMGLLLVLAFAAAAAAADGTCGGCRANNGCTAPGRCDQAMGRNVKFSKGCVYTWQGFPGNVSSPNQAQILLEKRAPALVAIGDPFTYEIQVSNRSVNPLTQVAVQDVLPADFVLAGVEPAAEARDGALNFLVGDLPPRSAKIFRVTGHSTRLGCLLFQGGATATAQFPLNLAVQVAECVLEIELVAGVGQCADLCDPIPVKVCLRNVGAVSSPDTVVALELPEGLSDEQGRRVVSWNLGEFAAGESKNFTATLRARQVGDQVLAATVMNGRGQSATAGAALRVRAPSLLIEKSGPVRAYLGHELAYQVSVTNTGDCPAKDVKLVDVWEGAKVKLLSSNPKAAGKGSRLSWNVGTLQPGQTFAAQVVMCAVEAGPVVNTACAAAFCADAKEARVTTEVAAAGGVMSEVTDEQDPVPADCVVVYRVTARNQGARPNTNVRFTAKLDSGMAFAGATGPTPVVADGDTLLFQPLPQLAGKQEAVWRVSVRMTPAALGGAVEADKRFITYLTTDQLDNSRPVVNAESTTVYQSETQTVRSSN